MEPNEITRINYFDGQFLTQGEFQAEQTYHMYLRRRLNYILFDDSGVLEIEPGDLRILPVNPPGDKTFQVSGGMAISRRTDQLEGREVIRTLAEESETFDLAATVGAGEIGFVALHYEEALQVPQTVASPETETQVRERAVITVHAGTWPPATSPPGGEQYILLGSVAFDDMSVDYGQRQTARIRSSLVGGGAPVPQAPTISNINPNNGEPGTSMPVILTGTNLSGSTVTSSHPQVTPTGVTTSDTEISLTLNIGAAVLGPVTLTIDNGTPPPASATFTVAQVIPNVVVDSFSPVLTNIQSAPPPGTLTVFGTNIRDAVLSSGDPATGTEIRLVDPSNFSNVVAVLSNPIVQSNAGTNQRVIADFPLTGDFGTQLSPVRVQVEFQSGIGTSSGNLALFF